MIITLTGFMGAGKSTIASKLAAHLFCDYADLDWVIEHGEGMSIDRIFSEKGQESFRKLEEIYLIKLIKECRNKVFVLSLGGGALISKKNCELITNETFCIYLKGSHSTILERLIKGQRERPLVKDKSPQELADEIVKLYQEREVGYLKSAKLIIDIDNKSVIDILKEIMSSI